MNYLARLMDKTDPTASLKHVAFAVAVCGAIVWLSYDIYRSPMTGNWAGAFTAFLAAVVTGKVVGSSPSPAPTVGVTPPISEPEPAEKP